MTLRTDELIAINALLRIPVPWIEPGPNVRGADVGDVSELAVSMSSIGQQEPVIVEQLGERTYRLIEGHRRRKAALLAGISHLDAVLRRTPGDCDRKLRQLAMHTHAKAFDPVAEARALHDLRFEHKLSLEQIAALIGRGLPWIRDRLALLQLTADEQAEVARRVLPLSQALGLVRERRAVRDGREVPRRTRRQPPRPERHFTVTHPLAPAAADHCRAGGDEHRARRILGGVACGECWEAAIRVDAS